MRMTADGILVIGVNPVILSGVYSFYCAQKLPNNILVVLSTGTGKMTLSSIGATFGARFANEWDSFMMKHPSLAVHDKIVNRHTCKLKLAMRESLGLGILNRRSFELAKLVDNLVVYPMTQLMQPLFRGYSEKPVLPGYAYNENVSEAFNKFHSFTPVIKEVVSTNITDVMKANPRPLGLGGIQSALKYFRRLRSHAVCERFMGRSKAIMAREARAWYKERNGNRNIRVDVIDEYVEKEFLPRVLNAINKKSCPESSTWLKAHASPTAIGMLRSLDSIEALVRENNDFVENITYDTQVRKSAFVQFHTLGKTSLFDTDEQILRQPAMIFLTDLRVFSDNEPAGLLKSYVSDVVCSLAITIQMNDSDSPLYIQEAQFLNNTKLRV